MKKLQIVLEIEVNEDEIKEIETTNGDNFTTDEYINGIIVKENNDFDSGAILIANEDEEYFNMNIGTCRVMNSPKIIDIKEL